FVKLPKHLQGRYYLVFPQKWRRSNMTTFGPPRSRSIVTMRGHRRRGYCRIPFDKLKTTETFDLLFLGPGKVRKPRTYCRPVVRLPTTALISPRMAKIFHVLPRPRSSIAA